MMLVYCSFLALLLRVSITQSDDKRLAFDKTIMELRLLAAAQPAPQVAYGGLRGMLGL